MNDQRQPDPDFAAFAARGFDTAAGPLVFLKHVGNDDVYQRNDVLLVIPGLWTSMPDDLLTAVRARRQTNVTGRCPACDATATASTGEIWHESWCQANDENIGPQLTAWSRQVGLYARGRRLTEDPA